MPVKKEPVKKVVPEKKPLVKMTRKGIVFEAPGEDVPNMVKNGWVRC